MKILEKGFTLCHNNIQYWINWITSSNNSFWIDFDEIYNTDVIEYFIIPENPLYYVRIKENLTMNDHFNAILYYLNVKQQSKYKNDVIPKSPFIENVECVEYEIKFNDNKYIIDYANHGYKFVYLTRY